MEAKQKYGKKDKGKNSQLEHQESQQQYSSYKPSKKSKKIKKNSYSNKEIITLAQSVVKGDLSKYLDFNFDQYLVPIYKTVNQYQIKNPRLNIDKIFSDEPQLVFQIKDNMDVNLEVYSQLIKSVQKQTSFDKVGLRSYNNNSKVQIPYLRQSIKNSQEEARANANQIVTEKEYALLKHRSQSFNLLEKQFKEDPLFIEYYLPNDPNKLIQLFSLCKMRIDQQRKIRTIIDGLFKRQDPFYEYNKPTLIQKYIKLQNELIAANNIKNLQKSFSETPIDFYNYHKANQFYEKKIQQIRFQKILNYSKFIKYVNSKKPKVDKQAKKVLHTACSGCFSQFSQITNPIQNCPQCSIRVHQHCQNIERRCHRCNYNRTSNKQKEKTSLCYICNRINEKGLMILTVTNNYHHQYAHVYCLLLHGLWTIQNKQMVGKYIKAGLQNGNCFYCNKNIGIFFNCSCCFKLMHGMCAYLNGVSMKMRRDGKKYTVELDCCTDNQLQQRLKNQRRFKINFREIIFDPDNELFKYIDKWKKYRQEYKI